MENILTRIRREIIYLRSQNLEPKEIVLSKDLKYELMDACSGSEYSLAATGEFMVAGLPLLTSYGNNVFQITHVPVLGHSDTLTTIRE
jgi:hypothetical protein